MKNKPSLFSFLITILYSEYNIAILYIIIINNISWMKTLWFDNTNDKNNNYEDNNSKTWEDNKNEDETTKNDTK